MKVITKASVICGLAIMLFFGVAQNVSAEKVNYNLSSIARESTLLPKKGTGDSLAQIAGNALGAVLSLVSALFFLLILYAGFMWMTSRGDAEQEKKAREVLFGAIVGVIIVLSAYAITRFLFQSIGVSDLVQVEVPTSQNDSGGQVNECSSAYSDFSCTGISNCGGIPETYAVEHDKVKEGVYAPGDKYILGLCEGEGIECCIPLEKEKACLIPDKENQGMYKCLDKVSPLNCSAQQGAVKENLEACQQDMFALNSQSGACLYFTKDTGQWSCNTFSKKDCDAEGVKNNTPSVYYSAKDAGVEYKQKCTDERDKRNSKQVYCLLDNGSCVLMDDKDCEKLNPATNRSFGFSNKDKETCEKIKGGTCALEYGTTGMECVANISGCKNDDTPKGAINKIFNEKKKGVPGNGYIGGVCPGSQVCCVKK